MRLCLLLSQKGVLCGVTTSDDPGGPRIRQIPHPRPASSDANFASSFRVLEFQPCRWGGLRRRPRLRVPFLRMGRSFARGLF